MAVAVAVTGALYLMRTGFAPKARGTDSEAPGALIPQTDVEEPPSPRDALETMEEIERLAAAGDVHLSERLAASVEEWVRRGPEAIPALRRYLESGTWIERGAAWQVRPGERAGGFRSMRMAVLTALARIPGPESANVLSAELERTASPGEICLIATELDRRGTATELGPHVLRALDLEAGGVEPDVGDELAVLAARVAPDITARRLEDQAPRLPGRRAPGPLAHALAALPWDLANRTGRRLLEDPQVHAKAKRRYLEALLERTEPDAPAVVLDAWRRGTLPGSLRKWILRGLESSPAQREDLLQWERARRDGRTKEAAQLRRRLERRLETGRALLEEIAREAQDSKAIGRAIERFEAQRLRLREDGG